MRCVDSGCRAREFNVWKAVFSFKLCSASSVKFILQWTSTRWKRLSRYRCEIWKRNVKIWNAFVVTVGIWTGMICLFWWRHSIRDGWNCAKSFTELVNSIKLYENFVKMISALFGNRCFRALSPGVSRLAVRPSTSGESSWWTTGLNHPETTKSIGRSHRKTSVAR